MIAETGFSVTYDGPALAAGVMPVRDLAPALLALGDLFTEASRVVYPESPPVALSIKATETGSFDVQLILHAGDLWDQFVDVFSGDAITALANLKELITGGTLGGLGLFGLIKWMRGRSIDVEEPAPTPGRVKITVEGASVEIPTDVVRMYRRVSIRQRARDVVAPLNRVGVEKIRFAEPGSPPKLVIEKEDVAAYDAAASEEGEVINEEERTLVLQIAGVSFEGRKWRLTDGEVAFWASIEDPQFLSDVERAAERFAQGDMLRCKIHVVQKRRPTGGLTTEYHVTHVLQHIPGPTQPELWEETR